MSKEQKKWKIDPKARKDDEKTYIDAPLDHDYVMDVESAGGSREKLNLDETSDSPPLTPSKGAHALKITKQFPTSADVLAAIQALHSRFDNQEQRMAEFYTKMTQNTVMIANLTKSIEFNTAGVKECKEKISVLETQVSILQKEVDELKERSREQDWYKQWWNLRIKGMKEKMDENIGQDVIRLLWEIAPEWSQKMDEYVDIVHHLGRKAENRTRQVIVQFTKRQCRDEIWKMTKKSEVCGAARSSSRSCIHFSKDLTSDQGGVAGEGKTLSGGKERKAGEKAYF